MIYYLYPNLTEYKHTYKCSNLSKCILNIVCSRLCCFHCGLKVELWSNHSSHTLRCSVPWTLPELAYPGFYGFQYQIWSLPCRDQLAGLYAQLHTTSLRLNSTQQYKGLVAESSSVYNVDMPWYISAAAAPLCLIVLLSLATIHTL